MSSKQQDSEEFDPFAVGFLGSDNNPVGKATANTNPSVQQTKSFPQAQEQQQEQPQPQQAAANDYAIPLGVSLLDPGMDESKDENDNDISQPQSAAIPAFAPYAVNANLPRNDAPPAFDPYVILKCFK